MKLGILILSVGNTISILRLLLIISFILANQFIFAQMAPSPPLYNPQPIPYDPWPIFSQPGRVVEKTVFERNSRKYLFTIAYRDSTILTIKSKIDVYKNRYFLSINEKGMFKSVTPSQTISLSRAGTNGELFTGIPADSCWLFKIVWGKINLYSVLAERNTKFVAAMQKGNDGPIVPITKENLTAIVGENNKMQALIKKEKLMEAIKEYNEQLEP